MTRRKPRPAKPAIHWAEAVSVAPAGLLGQALEASGNGRLKCFIQDETSPAIKIYRREAVQVSPSKGWDGECAGKWLYAVTRCAKRTGDKVITQNLRRVADFLVSQQAANGYLGTYNEAARFTAPEAKQTFDLWMNGWIAEGLTDAYTLLGNKKYLTAAKRLVDLFIATFQKEGRSVVNSAPFEGMASACIMDHCLALYTVTQEKKYLEFAEHCLQELENRPGTELVTRTRLNYDSAQIGSGKMYEMLHCYLGVAKLYGATGHKTHLQLLENAWKEVSRYHQNAAGAPCGGVHIHPECYNLRYMFSPYANSETCAMMDWLKLNVNLLEFTGEARYAEQIEKIAYNALLGAQFPDGYGWVYHSVMNGRRDRTGEFACCSSSGAIALEEIPPVLYSAGQNGIRVNVYGPSQATLVYQGQSIELEQITNYPFDGRISLRINPARDLKFPLALRIPAWIGSTGVMIDGKKVPAKANTFHVLTRKWKADDRLEIEFPLPLRTVEVIQEYNHKGEYIDARIPYVAVYRGPLLYATEWKDTLAESKPLLVPGNFSASDLKPIPTPVGLAGPAYELRLGGQAHVFVPYYEVGQRQNDSHHVVWLRKQGSPAPA